VVTTARAWARNADPASVGVAAILPKPYDLDALLETVRAIGDANRPGEPPATGGARPS